MSRPAAFEWDEDKAAANLAKHGVPFEAVPDMFLDEDRIDEPDVRFDYGEERRRLIARVDGLVLQATYTMRGDIGRIISARRASRKERRCYGDHS